VSIRSIAILGAGNGGCAAAADLGSRGYEIRLFNRSPGRLAAIAERGGLEKVGTTGDGFVPVSLVTADLGEAIAEADLVMLAAPISSYPFFARELAGLVDSRQPLFLNPGHMGGGLFLAREIYRLTGRTDVRTCEASTLTYACRMTGPTAVNIISTTTDLPFAAFPGRSQADLYDMMAPIYPELAPAANVLETGFLDINAVEHPAQTICNAGWLEHTKGDYLFYYEGTTPAVGRVIDAVDAERMAVAGAVGIATRPFADIFCQLGYTSATAAAAGGAYAAMQDSAPNRWIKGPRSLDHRYINEDVAWGLVPWSELGREHGVPTPTMDALIVLGGTLNGKDYRTDGLTPERLGLAGLDSDSVQSLLWNGFGT
jgi:opine dehydrogenase